MENLEKRTELIKTEAGPKSARSQKKIWIAVLVLVVILSASLGSIFGFISGGISQAIISRLAHKYPPLSRIINGSQEDSEIVKQKIIQEDSAVIDVVEKATPSVVSIVISKDVAAAKNYSSGPLGDDFFQQFFGGDNENQSQSDKASQKQTIGMGSGFLISSDGMIVTNKHVVDDDNASYTVITNDGKEYPAKVLAQDPLNDIAIIKIDGAGFPTITLGDSDSLKIGQTVIAIGNSLGEFSNTVSRGIVSGLRRSLVASGGLGENESLSNIIQTDAAINLGNSGGPLLSISGEVIGINVAKAQGAENIGFAIPSNQIKRVVEEVKTTGKISTPYIGVRYVAINDQIQKENNLPYNYGALVIRGQKITDLAVIPGSPSDKAGIIENDIILEVNGTRVDNDNPLANLIAQYKVGDQITLKVWHKGQEKNINLILEERK